MVFSKVLLCSFALQIILNINILGKAEANPSPGFPFFPYRQNVQNVQQSLPPVLQTLKDLGLECEHPNCPICLEGFQVNEQVVKLDCDPLHPHPEGIHLPCLNQVLLTKEACPLCRKRLSKNEIISYKLGDRSLTPITENPAYRKGSIIPLRADDQRIPAMLRFAELGHMYQVGDRIWSSATNYSYTYSDAKLFCNEIGGWLPTRKDWENLAKAMGKGTSTGYDPTLMRDMDQNSYWTSKREFLDFYKTAYFFNGSDGSTDSVNDIGNWMRVRCVRGIDYF